MPFNLAIGLTLFRIAAIPLVVLVFYLPFLWAKPAAAVIFSLAAITDWLDGWVARRYSQMSAFGAFLDPVADKLMVVVALVLIVQSDPRIILALVAAIMIGREITISALREWMSEMGARKHVAVSGFGKIKTILQMAGLALMLYTQPLFGQIPVYEIGQILVIIAAGLTLWSMFDYLRAAWPTLSKE